MTAPTPGSWLKKAPTEQATQSTTSSPKTPQTGKENSSTHSKNGSEKRRDPNLARCECGHQRRDHILDAYADRGSCERGSCDCVKFKRPPRPEHLTSRPFAQDTGLIILKDRLTVHDGTHKNNKRRTKKGKKR